MQLFPVQLILGVLFAGLIAFGAFRLNLLSKNGGVAAFILGSLVFGLGGLRWAIVLVAFFLTSSGLSRAFKNRKSSIQNNYAKGSTRDASQVSANGGLAGLFVLLHFFFPTSPYPWIGFCAALAAANADTWATEIGGLSAIQPRLITTMKRVETGTSGAVSSLGITAALAGSFIIAILSTLIDPFAAAQPAMTVMIVITIGGLVGSLVDSLLGATVQAIYFCHDCHKETEKTPIHTCGAETTLIKGIPWMNNDLVNVLCTFSGALVALLIILLSGNFLA
jgi:uncharacterized protein (TIGR00297 family)